MRSPDRLDRGDATLKPVRIPDGLAIEGATKVPIKGDHVGAENIEEAFISTSTLDTPEGPKETHVVSVLIQCDEIDMRSLHFDQRFWLHFYGAPILPFALDTAFVSGSADETDALTKQLQELGQLLALAWTIHANGSPEKGKALDEVLTKITELAGTARLGTGLEVPGLRSV